MSYARLGLSKLRMELLPETDDTASQSLCLIFMYLLDTLRLGQMATILQTKFFKLIFFYENNWILI